MTTSTSISSFHSLLNSIESNNQLSQIITNPQFQYLLENLRQVDAFSHSLSDGMEENTSYRATSLLRKLKTAYAMPAVQLFLSLKQLADEIAPDSSQNWQQMAAMAKEQPDGQLSISKLLLKYSTDNKVMELLDRLETEDPHAIYPTSSYRTSSGTVNSTEDGSYIEAVMTTSTMTEINITEGVLDHDNHILYNLYQPLGRCVCLLDSNVSEHYGEEIKAYFEFHDIDLELLVYRAMEVDKGIQMVEQLLADFKRVGVSRQEPVLIVGGGVIADTGGLACSLYHRSTPYVMLATSIVSGIDAGPSPRTCCDGFGFKNLFGAYHAPVLTLTDRTFFKTLRSGWIRHGVAEIIKMAVVKDAQLFDLLEETGIELVYSGFGTVTDDEKLSANGQRILSLAMRSYVEAEYGNLYETHQCRPHAYGHTWSPGYEIPSGMLHGHAVATGMGFGAQLSFLQGWITESDRNRILKLISNFELSLWHPILDNTDLVYQAQVKVTEKRGGNLVAPLPKGEIGKCGYLNVLTKNQLAKALSDYKDICQDYPRNGYGIEPLCEDVGLEDPSTVGHGIKAEPVFSE
ncbi:sedoheptulose 7-phosphate cyclase [Nonlabens antarcticus]|uniref:sedoheptulose 7-phosphate cyclase n=1 Tax=Nonlabens antarcticus TaxID=392714 RepID=UPI0018919752|nr:sedoheptulose 7-phosphate cyclase [Nonlabens antarcticus]